MNRSMFLSIAFAVAIATDVAAATLYVPAQYSTVQAAINAALPFDTIIVAGGTHDPIVIPKSLTIIGDPMVTFDNSPIPGVDLFVDPAITIQAPGQSTVRLVGVRTTGLADGNSAWSSLAPSIHAPMVSRLIIENSDIRATVWFNLTGVGQGEPAIETQASFVRISRSIVRGGVSDTDACDYTSVPNSAPGIDAPAATVVAINSDIRGGNSANLCFSPGNCTPCPCTQYGGLPGVGVRAARLLFGGPASQIVGGIGQPVYCGATPIGSLPNAVNWQVSVAAINLGNKLTTNGALEVNKTTTLTATGTSANTLLLLGSASDPLFVGNAYGYLFIVPNSMTVITFPFLSNFGLAVPNSPALVGADVAVQVYDPSFKLSNPFLSVIVP